MEKGGALSLIERTRTALLGARMEPPSGVPPELLGAVVFRRGRLIPWIGGVLGRMAGPAAAVTLRRTIVVHPDAPLTPTLLAHELVHVRQWREDFLFPLRYTVATLRHGYHDNPYEVEARELSASAARTSSPESPT